MGHYVLVQLQVDKPDPRTWLDEGGCWERSVLIPTLTRALSSAKPMPHPAGIDTASELAISRWSADEHCFQVYNYESCHMIYDRGLKDYRLPSPEECEQLMSIDKYYTLVAVKEDFTSRKTFVIRRQLIGNSFNVAAVSFLIGDLFAGTFRHSIPPLESHLATITYDPPMSELIEHQEEAKGTVPQQLEMVKQ